MRDLNAYRPARSAAGVAHIWGGPEPYVLDRVTHFEIPCGDIPKVREFYESVFGWRITKIPDMDYHWILTTESDPNTWMPKEAGAINGGMREKRAPGDGPVMVVSVDSMDDRLESVRGAGGEVVLPKTRIGDHGFYAQVSDVEGNVLGLWQSKGGGGEPA